MNQTTKATSFSYDDEAHFFRIIVTYYPHIMTDVERRIWQTFTEELWADEGVEDPVYQRQRQELVDNARHEDPHVLIASAAGYEVFARFVARRIARCHLRDLNLNRCPKCGRIPRTPRAEQCFWCHHDWH